MKLFLQVDSNQSACRRMDIFSIRIKEKSLARQSEANIDRTYDLCSRNVTRVYIKIPLGNIGRSKNGKYDLDLIFKTCRK